MSPGPLSFPEDEPSGDRPAEAPEHPAPHIPPPARPPARYGWVAGVVIAAILVYIGLNTLRNSGSVTRGVDPGHRLPPFATPLALSRRNADANVATCTYCTDTGTCNTGNACPGNINPTDSAVDCSHG